MNDDEQDVPPSRPCDGDEPEAAKDDPSDRPGGERGPAEPPREDPEAPANSVEDPWADEAVEPNEPG